MVRVILRKDALAAIVVASIEVFKKESYGLLVGEKRGKRVIVRDAFGFQTAMRDYYSSEVFEFREKRVNYSLKYLTALKLIGDFHSHTNGHSSLSEADKRMLEKTDPGFISLLCSIRKTKREAEWKYSAKKMALSGSIGKKYHVTIRAFVFDEKKGAVKGVPLIFPKKSELDKRLKYFRALEKKFKHARKQEKKAVKRKRKLKKKLSGK